MKVNWKDLGLAMVVSLVLICIIGIVILSSLPSESDYEGGLSSGGNLDRPALYRNIVLIVLVGGFFSGTLFVYLVIEDLKKKKK